MKNPAYRVGRTCLAAITVVSLGLGAVQAFAAPAWADQARRACEPFTCEQNCIAAGYATGICTYRGCRCYS